VYSYRAACSSGTDLRSLDKLLLVASAIEMIHTATLIHDDILDGALIRRHLPTMHTRWDKGVSVMAGDVLFTKALDLVTQLDELEPYRILAGACHKTCYGELRQMGTRNRFDLSVDDYLEIVTGKTAALIECSSRMGAWYAGADADAIEQFRLFGREIGVAFQIVDDVLDLVGNEKTMGKTLGTDILHKKPTLPVLMYFETLQEDSRHLAIQQLAEEGDDEVYVQELVAKIQASGAVEAAITYADNLANSAAERVQRFAAANPRSLESQQAVDALGTIAAFVVQREK
jgi:octaprenyl-diphosphate synthase